MQVYGDQARRATPGELLAEVEADLRAGERVSALIGLGQLLQGAADAEFAARGADARSPAQDALAAALTELAATTLTAHSRGSGNPGFEGGAGLPGKAWVLASARMSEWGEREIEARAPEGYAFYALHPALYAAAARRLPPGDWQVIGLRSIGTSLAAVAAAALGAPPPVTVRPVGHPFARTLALAPELEAELAAHAGPFVIVDEGPGLSGSSFGAAADALERLGVARERVAFLPGHGGDLGPAASPEHRSRWAAARRPVAAFDAVILPQLLAAAEALVGPALSPPEDVSGGRWRERLGVSAPAWPAQERRKLLLRTASGTWLLKFAGLGRIGRRKLERARRLHAAGWTPEPAGLAEGFLVERWFADARPARPSPEALGDYLAVRAAAPAELGADAATLWAMTRANADEALGPAAAEALDRRAPDLVRLAALAPAVETDGRLHRWEWGVRPNGRAIKFDALDHCEAHDLIGAQPIAWDLAGAELELSPADIERLRARLAVRPELLALHRLAYPAFQLGLWTLAGEPAQAAGYARRLAALLGVDPPSPPG